MRHEHDCETIEFQNALHAFHSLGSLLLPSPCAYLTMHTLSRHLVCLPFLGRVPTNSLFSTCLRLSLVKTRPGLLPHRAHSRIALLPFKATLHAPGHREFDPILLFLSPSSHPITQSTGLKSI